LQQLVIVTRLYRSDLGRRNSNRCWKFQALFIEGMALQGKVIGMFPFA